MAESASAIIQRQIEALQRTAPPPLTQAEREQIMRGRKSQADIDTGRRAIQQRADEVKAYSDQINTLSGQLQQASQVETQETARQGQEAARREREANANPLWNTTIPAAAGAAGGAAIGEIENRILHEFSRGNAEAVKGIAKELGPIDQMTDSRMNRARMEGAARAAEKYAPSSPMRQGGAVLGRGLSYGIPAGIFYNEYQKYADRAADPNATDADKLSNQQVSNALLGVSTGIAADGGMRFFFPSRHDGEGEAMARINAARSLSGRMDETEARRPTNALIPRGQMAPAPSRNVIDVTPEPPRQALAAPTEAAPTAAPAQDAEPATGSQKYLKARAKQLGLSQQGTKTELLERISTKEATFANKRVRGPKAPAIVAPLVGAGVAADAAYNSARADGASPVGAAASAVPAATVAGGTTAAAGYGINRLMGALPSVGRAVGGALSAAAPTMATDMTDYSPDELSQANNWMSQNLPQWAMPPAAEQVRQMAQVPERRPADPFDETLAQFETFLRSR